MSSPPASSLRQQLRQSLRARRRALSPAQQRKAARALARRLAQLPALRDARRIALYWPNDGEIDVRGLRCQHGFLHRDFYLPVLRAFPASTLVFVRWHGGRRLHRNRFGIPEPRGARRPAQAMDAILMPLTGFDAAGNRLGMGGGFYDRTLAFCRRVPRPHPLLVGVAHACQQVTHLPVQGWDVPLATVVTDCRVFR